MNVEADKHTSDSAGLWYKVSVVIGVTSGDLR